MIYAVEGPDKSGKTTLWNELKECATAIFVPGPIVTREMVPVMQHVELNLLRMWEAFYYPWMTYVCDRTVMTSGPVYDALFDRPFLGDLAPWYDRVTVLYVDTPVWLLNERLTAAGGDEVIVAEDYERLRNLYMEHLAKFHRTYRLDGRKTLKQQVKEALEVIL